MSEESEWPIATEASTASKIYEISRQAEPMSAEHLSISVRGASTPQFESQKSVGGHRDTCH